MKKRLLIILAFLLIGLNLSVQAYDFSSVISQNTIYFKIKDSLNKYVEVTSEFDTGLFYNSENKPKSANKPDPKLLSTSDPIINEASRFFLVIMFSTPQLSSASYLDPGLVTISILSIFEAAVFLK